MNRNIEALQEPFKTKVKARLKANPQVFITETTRSIERQRELVASGYSKTMDSNHLKWLAVDIAFYWAELYPNNYQKRRELANSALRHWIVRGYDMRNRDKPHFQDSWYPLSHYKIYNMLELDYLQILNEEFPDREELFDYATDWQIKALIEIWLLRIWLEKWNDININDLLNEIWKKLQS